ncbi:hypothetical protein KIL84_003429 [Mauremys mutica]|uniref:Motilin/ghrelin-associated peptide domain-containing protein n=1 Tax=Mauremys mutica TaxID=74926 RepID=A0A9D3WU49_9SAUR|nr:hypothetical protein KIL84_003429 [Mauremys mutica]
MDSTETTFICKGAVKCTKSSQVQAQNERPCQGTSDFQNQQRKDPKKHTKLNRRAAEGFLDADARQAEGDNNEMEIKLNVPFEIGVKITEEQYQEYGQVLEKILEDILAEDTKETQNWHELKHEDITN